MQAKYSKNVENTASQITNEIIKTSLILLITVIVSFYIAKNTTCGMKYLSNCHIHCCI